MTGQVPEIEFPHPAIRWIILAVVVAGGVAALVLLAYQSRQRPGRHSPEWLDDPANRRPGYTPSLESTTVDLGVDDLRAIIIDAQRRRRALDAQQPR